MSFDPPTDDEYEGMLAPRSNLRSVIVWGVVFFAAAACIAAFIVGNSGACTADACKAPVDWNPTADCRPHGGVQSMTANDGSAIAGAVCRDGVAILNPY